MGITGKRYTIRRIKMNKPKFNIGDTVFNTVSRKGSYEPSICDVMSKLKVDKVEKSGNTFKYTCDMDGYIFTEDELASKEEVLEAIKKN